MGVIFGVICRKFVFRPNSGNLFGEFALWGRKTHFQQIEFAGNGAENHFRPIHPHKGSSAGVRQMGGPIQFWREGLEFDQETFHDLRDDLLLFIAV